MNPTAVLEDLIRRARRRCLSNLLLKQTVQAACVAMGGLILLLVLGTEILDARWLAALFVTGLGVGFRNLRKELPTRYGIAQAIDRKMGLHDALSTAFFFTRLAPAGRAPEELRTVQLARAAAAARDVPVSRAFPYSAPKSLYFMSVLGLIASSLIAVRYGISRSLDLHPPLARIVLDVFHFAQQPPKVAQAKKKDAASKRTDDLLKQFGLALDDAAAKPEANQEEPATAQALDPSPSRKTAQAGQMKQDGISLDPKEDQAAASGEAREGEQDRGAASGSEPGSESSTPNGRQQASNPQRQNDSLLDKFRDAMSNLLSRLKPQPRNGQAQQMTAQSRPDPQGRQGQGQKGAQQMAGRQTDSSRDGQPQGEQDAQGAQKSEAGAGKQSGEEAERASQEGRSGIGKQDGSKAVKDAEQLAAMGKISEILGRRSQTLTGDMMVEVNSGKEQPLRTPYSQQSATHADAGGEIHRDEIPLAYQRYVQQYFEEIRKAAPPAPKPAAPAQP